MHADLAIDPVRAAFDTDIRPRGRAEPDADARSVSDLAIRPDDETGAPRDAAGTARDAVRFLAGRRGDAADAQSDHRVIAVRRHPDVLEATVLDERVATVDVDL